MPPASTAPKLRAASLPPLREALESAPLSGARPIANLLAQQDHPTVRIPRLKRVVASSR